MHSHSANDPTRRVPGRLLELLAEVTGHALTPHAASAATQDAWVDPDAWVPPALRAARLAGLKAARFSVDSAADVTRLCLLAEDPSVRELQPLVAMLVDRCSQNYHFLDTQLQRLQGELDRVTAARGRLRNMAPAYRGLAAGQGESRLNTAA